MPATADRECIIAEVDLMETLGCVLLIQGEVYDDRCGPLIVVWPTVEILDRTGCDPPDDVLATHREAVREALVRAWEA